MKNAVFFDIDGTLWNMHMQIPESTVSAIRKLRENGDYAFICSGRSRSNIRTPELLNIGFDGVIASCGAHIDFHKETAYQVLLSAKQVAHALSVLKKYHLPVVLEGPEYVYVNEDDFLDDPYVVHLRKELGEHLKSIPSDPAEIRINKMSCLAKDLDIPAFIRDMGDEFDVIVHKELLGHGVLEINPAGLSKATGIKKVCEMLDIPLENTYAFGDSANDIEMLSFVAHSVAMGNGTEEVKEKAEYVTTGVDEDGIYNGLLHYGLI